MLYREAGCGHRRRLDHEAAGRRGAAAPADGHPGTARALRRHGPRRPVAGVQPHARHAGTRTRTGVRPSTACRRRARGSRPAGTGWARWWTRTGGPSLRSPVQRAALQRYARDWLPGVDADSLTDISCTYTTTLDENFVLDRIGPVVIGAGFSGHGFKFTPVVGRILADLATGAAGRRPSSRHPARGPLTSRRGPSAARSTSRPSRASAAWATRASHRVAGCAGRLGPVLSRPADTRGNSMKYGKELLSTRSGSATVQQQHPTPVSSAQSVAPHQGAPGPAPPAAGRSARWTGSSAVWRGCCWFLPRPALAPGQSPGRWTPASARDGGPSAASSARRTRRRVAGPGRCSAGCRCPPGVDVPGVGAPHQQPAFATKALDVLATLPVKGRAPKTGYDRAQFGQAWADVDRNGCDTRNDILAPRPHGR